MKKKVIKIPLKKMKKQVPLKDELHAKLKEMAAEIEMPLYRYINSLLQNVVDALELQRTTEE